MQLLGLQGPWQRKVCRVTGLSLPQELWPYLSLFFEPLVAGDQKASLASFSVAPSIQALKGLPCLGSFVVWRVRPIEGPPWLGSYSVVWHISHLKEHPGWGPDL